MLRYRFSTALAVLLAWVTVEAGQGTEDMAVDVSAMMKMAEGAKGEKSDKSPFPKFEDVTKDLESKKNTFESMEGAFAAAIEYVRENEPSRNYVARLLAFEKEHGGQLVGLMALRKIFRHAGMAVLRPQCDFHNSRTRLDSSPRVGV